MLPLYELLGAPKSFVGIRFRQLALFYSALPMCSCIYCILWCMFYDFEDSTATHCGVPNYLPSVSAAIGDNDSLCTLMRSVALVHLFLGFVVVGLYLKYFRDSVHRKKRSCAALACVLHVFENLGVVGMTQWTSTENYTIHCLSFIIVIVCGLIYMVISYSLFKWARKMPPQPMEIKAQRCKRTCILVNVICLLAAICCYVRHNSYCEPGMYTIFALFEYGFVFSNMCYHMTAYLDFYTVVVHFDWRRGVHIIKY